MNNSKNNSGHSMIEMLGVLAVVGVLSIGAIIGYRYALTKAQANKTQAELSTWAVTCSMQLIKNTDILNTAELGTTTKLGYPIAAFLLEDAPDFFEITVDSIPAAVCEHLLRLEWTAPVQISVNDIQYKKDVSVCGTTPATLTYLFQNNLSIPSWQDCPLASRCGTLCCEPATICAKDGITCENPDDTECINNNDCGKEGNGKYYCHKDYKDLGQEKEKGTCKPASYTTKIASNGRKYYKSGAIMSWRSGERFCAAIGKQVIDKKSDLGCSLTSIMDCPAPTTSPCNGAVLQSLYAPSETAPIWEGHFWANSRDAIYHYDLDFQTGCGTSNLGETKYFALCR